MPAASEIGQIFLDFYQGRGFSVLPSASLLDPSIPMSFVMSAGLVQVESALSRVGRQEGQKYVLLQKCFRHFDVENVGTDERHLSFFEMPGAFIFGEIPREVVVQQMWSLITDALQLDPDRLWVSYFAGGEKAGHHFDPDESTLEAWMKIGLPRTRIVGLGPEHNLWIQGRGFESQDADRKCGPNTEIFWDHGSEYSCRSICQPGCNCGRYLEIANSLFIRSRIGSNGKIDLLEEPFTETVVGTERTATLTQKRKSIFEIDVFEPIVAAIKSFLDDLAFDLSMRQQQIYIIADHLRALLYLIADGAPPPWGTDGYTGGRHRLVRILIRRVLTAQLLLGIRDASFLSSVINAVVKASGEASKLESARDTLCLYFAREVERFMETLKKGKSQLDAFLRDNPRMILSGAQTLHLEKNYGMPKLLIEQESFLRGAMLDQSGYESALHEWEKQRVSRVGKTPETIWRAPKSA